MGESAETLLVGGARIFFDPGTGWVNLGNIPQLALTRVIEKLEHFSSTNGERIKDKSIITTASLGLNVTIDNLDAENMSFLMYSDPPTSVVQAGATIVDEVQTTPSNLDTDKVMFTAESDISSFQADDDLLVASPFVLGTDYNILDATTGAITILATGSITTSTIIYFTYTSAARTRSKITPGTDFVKTGKLKLVFTPSSGLAQEYTAQNASLTVEGDTPLSSIDWSTADVIFDILKDETVTPSQPYGEYLIG